MRSPITHMSGISFISPFSVMEKAAKHSNFHMVLAHLVLREQEYADFYRNEKKFKLLDNSFFELGECLKPYEVLKAAEKVKADCLILTDGSLDSIEQYKKEGYYVMYIPKDAISFKIAMRAPEINKVGISCLHIPQYMGREAFEGNTRRDFLKANWEKSFDKSKVHLLGSMHRPLVELETIRDYASSIDTSYPVWAGMNKQLIRNREKRYTHCNFYTDLAWQNECGENIKDFQEVFLKIVDGSLF